jgi:hypothetical protein
VLEQVPPGRHWRERHDAEAVVLLRGCDPMLLDLLALEGLAGHIRRGVFVFLGVVRVVVEALIHKAVIPLVLAILSPLCVCVIFPVVLW